MKEEFAPINILLERFFEGQTSIKEEQELYRFFMRDEIPAALARYKPLIKYFESGLADEVQPETRTPKKKQWIVWSGIAASILLMLCLSFYFFTAKQSPDPLEGSYIIRNGVRITDLNLIRPELETAIQKVMLQEQEMEQLIDKLFQIDYNPEVQIMQDVQAHYNRILSNIQDEEIRKEVAIIFNSN
jgi:hypothetical protein